MYLLNYIPFHEDCRFPRSSIQHIEDSCHRHGVEIITDLEIDSLP